VRTVKEIAIDLEVTIQTVYNHIKKNEKELKGCTFKSQGTTLIDDEGIRIIKESMGLIQPPTVKEKISMENIINDISDLVTENVSANINNKMDKLEQEIQDLKEQNKLLIELMQEQKQKKSIFNLFKR
jgi:polyhydroxyalkanoate synthesis regulator phasin